VTHYEKKRKTGDLMQITQSKGVRVREVMKLGIKMSGVAEGGNRINIF